MILTLDPKNSKRSSSTNFGSFELRLKLYVRNLSWTHQFNEISKLAKLVEKENFENVVRIILRSFVLSYENTAYNGRRLGVMLVVRLPAVAVTLNSFA